MSKHICFGIFPGTQAMRDAIAAINSNGYTLEVTPQKVNRIHAIVDDNYSNAGAVYAATWDGIAPYVILQVGTVALTNMAFLGWPMIDKAAWDLANPPPP